MFIGVGMDIDARILFCEIPFDGRSNNIFS
jgi:hypothetical protein